MTNRSVAGVNFDGHAAVPLDQLRLITKVSRLYFERGMRQPEIAAQLSLSQSRVSRLLKQAADLGIVRTTVVTPSGIYADLEEAIEARYALRHAVVADTGDASDERELLPALGAATAHYLETTLTGRDVVGISSWSASLLATVDAMTPRNAQVATEVVQVLGGLGNITAQAYATRLTGRLAELTRASAVFLPAPGLVTSREAREALMADSSIASVLRAYHRLTMVLVGIGSLQPSELLRESGNAIGEKEQDELRRLGAVGDICLRFFDQDGVLVRSSLDDRVLGITADELRRVPRKVAVAGGDRKFTAIRAALRGGWVDVLVTDARTAQRLAATPAQAPGSPPASLRKSARTRATG